MQVDLAKRFLTFVGSSLGGISALLYAAGFLVETGRWAKLGVLQLELLSQQYIATGARFFLLLLPSTYSGLGFLAVRGLTDLALVVVLGVGTAWLWFGAARRHMAVAFAEVLLMVLLAHALFGAPDSFLGPLRMTDTHLSFGTRDLLFSLDASPPPDEARTMDNYFFLAARYALLMAVSAGVLVARVHVLKEPSSPGDGFRWTGRLASALRVPVDVTRFWRAFHATSTATIWMLLALITLLLPANYSHTLIYGSLPLVDPATLPSGLVAQSDATVYLLRRDGGHLMFFVEEYPPDGTARAYVSIVRRETVPRVDVIGTRAIFY